MPDQPAQVMKPVLPDEQDAVVVLAEPLPRVVGVDPGRRRRPQAPVVPVDGERPAAPAGAEAPGHEHPVASRSRRRPRRAVASTVSGVSSSSALKAGSRLWTAMSGRVPPPKAQKPRQVNGA